MVSVLVQVRVLLAAGGRVATVGQLLFAPWAWAYSTLHPLGVGKVSTGYGHGWAGGRHVPERLYDGTVLGAV